MKKILIVLAIISIVLFIPSIEQFTIADGKTGKLVYCSNIDNFSNFYISFTHSVNRTPVNEYYRTEGSSFVVYKTTFYSYGAGMPDRSDYIDAEIKLNNGLIEIDNINRKLKEFAYIVGTYAGHTLNAGNISFKLEKYVEPQQPALFRIRKVSIFDILIH